MPRRLPGLTVGVDVGGTKVLAGAVDDDGRVAETARRSTPGRRVAVEMVEQAIVEAVHEVAGPRPVAAVGVAAAGFVDAAGERVRFAPHLPWQGEDVRARLTRAIGAPVVLDNDANAAAWAEWRFGAARGRRHVLMVTLGTGIGGGVILDGRLHRGLNGMAGEFGHAQLVPDGALCECGGRGCWEQYCSGNALVRAVRRLRAAEGVESGPDLSGPAITAAAQAGDPIALAAFAEIGDWLGVGVAGLVASYDPELVVIGGGVSAAGEIVLAPARAALARSLVGAQHRELPGLVAAELGPEAGLVGAADLARAALAHGGRRRTRPRRRLRDAGSQAPVPRRAARGTARRR